MSECCVCVGGGGGGVHAFLVNHLGVKLHTVLYMQPLALGMVKKKCMGMHDQREKFCGWAELTIAPPPPPPNITLMYIDHMEAQLNYVTLPTLD